MNISKKNYYRNPHAFLQGVYDLFSSHSSWDVLSWEPYRRRLNSSLLPIENSNAQDGLNSWDANGIFASNGTSTPQTSSGVDTSCFAAQQGFSASMEQKIAITTSSHTSIDAGIGELMMTCLCSYQGSGNAHVEITFFDNNDYALPSALTTHIPREDEEDVWHLRRYKIPIPIGARFANVRIIFFPEGVFPWGFFIRSIQSIITFPAKDSSLLRVCNHHEHFCLEISAYKNKKIIDIVLLPRDEKKTSHTIALPLENNVTAHCILGDSHCAIILHLRNKKFSSMYVGDIAPIVPFYTKPLLYMGSSNVHSRILQGSMVQSTQAYIWMNSQWYDQVNIWPWTVDTIEIFQNINVKQGDTTPLLPATVLIKEEHKTYTIGHLRNIFATPISSINSITFYASIGQQRFYPESTTNGFSVPEEA